MKVSELIYQLVTEAGDRLDADVTFEGVGKVTVEGEDHEADFEFEDATITSGRFHNTVRVQLK